MRPEQTMRNTLSLIVMGIILLATAGCGGGSVGSMDGSAIEPLSSVGSGKQFRYDFDVALGFNFQIARKVRVGYLNYLKIGDNVLKADIAAVDPTNPATSMKVVGILSDLVWDGGYSDPVHLSGQVLVVNKQLLAMPILMDIPDQKVEFQFTVYDFDSTTKAYYKALYASNTLYGVVQRSSGSQNLFVDRDPSTKVLSPENYAFWLGVSPRAVAQAITSSSVAGEYRMKWGFFFIN
jgi:hypothetical protein